MPYEATIRWIALGLLSLGVLWVILAGTGLRPRAMRLRRTIKRSGTATLVCGACGHPAVSLGSIETCPECGAVYAEVGLDGTATAARWSPPPTVLAIVLLGGVALGAVELAPWVAGKANQVSIGTSGVETVISSSPFLPNKHDPQTGKPPPIAIQIDGDVVRAHRPATNSLGTSLGWNPRSPRVPASDILESTITIRLTVGVGWTEAYESWNSQAYPPTKAPPYSFMSGVGSWDAMQAVVPTHVLEVRYNAQRWTLRDPTGRVVDRGEGLRAGIESLYEHAGIGDDLAHPWSNADSSWDELDSIIEETNTSTDQYWPDPWLTGADDADFRPIGRVDSKTSLHHIHPASAWGLTAAITTTGMLVLLAIFLFFVSQRTRRRPTSAPASRN